MLQAQAGVGQCSREWACDAPAGQRANQAVDSCGRDDLVCGSGDQCRHRRERRQSRTGARRRSERRRSSSASNDDDGGFTARCASGGKNNPWVRRRRARDGDRHDSQHLPRRQYNRPIRAALDRTGRDGVLALGHANHKLREVVDRTDFATRSELLAEEIAAARPDLVGLQEVALWRRGPMELDQIGRPDATVVDYDFLAMLLADLAARGIRYETVHVQQESDVEAPAFTGNPFTGSADSAQDVRLTDRDVILVRSDAGIRIEGSGGANFSQRLEVNSATPPSIRTRVRVG